MIASDLNNPNFAGAQNPDRNLTCEFSSKPVHNEFLSTKEGRPIFSDVDFVKIYIPGNMLSIIETFAREDHKQRFPREWAAYQNSQNGDSVAGTPIGKWPLITPAMAEELKYMKFTTVESVAHAGDGQLQALGMKAGMSPFAFRDRARNFLAAFNSDASLTKTEEEMQSLRDENAKMQAQMAELMTLVQPKGKPGRKPKEIPEEEG